MTHVALILIAATITSGVACAQFAGAFRGQQVEPLPEGFKPASTNTFIVQCPAVARILLHDTKSMVALPGRVYDMKGIGWQQECWRMGSGGPGGGVDGHRFWLPWISANHLYGITDLEEFDPVLYQQPVRGN
jgi:hypothetical protein